MATQEQNTVAFVLYPGLTLLDLVGPLQVFASLRRFSDQYRPVVVAERLEPMPSDGPLKVIADRTFGDVPDPAVVIVPGGGAPTIKAWATQRSATICARPPTGHRWSGQSAPGR
jgi:putative intracellular protease/amidase